MSRTNAIRVEDVLPPGWIDLFSRQHPEIGIGCDLGTTTKAKSNPTSIAVMQKVAMMKYARLVLRFKNDDPAVLRAIFVLLLDGLQAAGLKARRLGIDATNERFFAVQLRRDLARRVPVQLIINSEKTTYGAEEMLWKSYLANLFIDEMEDGLIALPPGKWLQIDLRQTVRDRGTFACDVQSDGGHGDCHRALEIATHCIVAKGGPAHASAAAVGAYGHRGAGASRGRSRGMLKSKAHRGGQRRPI